VYSFFLEPARKKILVHVNIAHIVWVWIKLSLNDDSTVALTGDADAIQKNLRTALRRPAAGPGFGGQHG
jgi:hypothetical protein